MGPIDDLDAARERLHEYHALIAAEAAVAAQIAELEPTLTEARVEYVDETQDVQRVSRLTLGSVFARLAGSHDDRVAREQAEADAARLRMDGLVERMRRLRDELSRVRYEVGAAADAPDRHREAMAAIERELNPDDPRTQEFRALLAELETVENHLRWAQRAHKAGRDAVAAVDHVLVLLDDAKFWSNVDVFAPRWIEVDEQHRAFTAAQLSGLEAERTVDQFLRVARMMPGTVRVPIISSEWLGDVVFNNILIDFARNRQINRSREQVTVVREWIADQVQRLGASADEASARVEELTRQRAALHGA